MTSAASAIVLMVEMKDVAQKASEAWLKNALAHGPAFTVSQGNQGLPIGAMLDLCGGAWLEFKDRRTKAFKAFQTAGYVRGGHIKLDYPLRVRQEQGLHIAACQAAHAIMKEHGWTEVFLHTYID
jgi:hypothetical protein